MKISRGDVAKHDMRSTKQRRKGGSHLASLGRNWEVHARAVADSHRQSISRVIGAKLPIDSEQRVNHHLHLMLLGSPVSDHADL